MTSDHLLRKIDAAIGFDTGGQRAADTGSAGAVQAAFPGLPIRVRIERQLMPAVQCTYRPFLRLKLSEMLPEAPFARITAALLRRRSLSADFRCARLSLALPPGGPSEDRSETGFV